MTRLKLKQNYRLLTSSLIIIKVHPVKKHSIATLLLTATLLAGCAAPQTKKSALLSDWPAGKSPQEIGHQIVTNMLPRWIVTKPYVHYAEDSTSVHALQFAALTGDAQLKEALIRRYDRFLELGGTNLISMRRHVDHSIFGIVPLELKSLQTYLNGRGCRPHHPAETVEDRRGGLA